MRTVFVCELRKLCRNSSFLLFGALLLLASVLYPFGRALAPDANGVNLLKKQAVFAAYPDSTPAEAAADLAARQDALDVSVALLMLQQAPNQTVRDMALRMLADRGYTAEDLPALREAGALRFGSSIAQERVILQEGLDQAERALAYPDYLQQIAQRADQLGQTIFARSGGLDIQIARRTAEQYAALDGLTIPYASPYGAEIGLGDGVSDCLVLLFAFLLAMSVFAQDRRPMAAPVVRAARCGLGRSYAAKALLSGGLLLLFWAVSLAAQMGCGGLLLGFGDLSRCVQSLPDFFRAPGRMTVGGLLAAAPVCRLLGALVALALFAVFCCLLAGAPAYGACAAAAALGWGLYALVPESSPLRLLKYLTPAAWLRPELLFGDYLLFPFGPALVPYTALYGGLVAASLAGLAALGRAAYGGQVVALPALRRPGLRRRKRRPTLFGFELRKLLRTQGAVAVLLLLTAAQLFAASTFTTLTTEEDARYEAWLTTLQGPYTEQKHQQVLDAYEKIRELEAEIAPDRNGAESALLQTVLQDKPVLVRLGQLSNRLKARAESGLSAAYIPDAGYARMLGFEAVGPRYQPFLVAVLLVLALSGLFAVERETGLILLDKTLPCATGRLYWTKAGVCCAVTVVIHAAVWLPETVFLFRHYSFPLPWAEAGSLTELAGAPQGMPLWGAVLATWLIRLTGSLCFAALLFAAGIRAPSTVSALLGGAGLLLAVFLLDALAPAPLDRFTLVWLMQGDTAAVLDAPVLATALTCLALTILLFGLGEYRWLKALDKPNF